MTVAARFAAPLALLLLAGCATQETKVVRWPLAYRSYFEATLPKGWQAEPSFGPGPRLILVRLSGRESGATQLTVAPRLQVRPADDAAAAARQELASSRACDGVGTQIEQRPLPALRGVAVSCSRQRAAGGSPLVPSTAGVIVAGELVAPFTMLDVSADDAAAAWGILQSIRINTIMATP